MIENKHQLNITLEQARRFEVAISDTMSAAPPVGTDPVIWEAYIAGMRSQLATLEGEISDYAAVE